jgi:hypothetical protein
MINQYFAWTLLFVMIGLTLAFMLDEFKWYWRILTIFLWPLLVVLFVFALIYEGIIYIYKMCKKGIVKLWKLFTC